MQCSKRRGITPVSTGSSGLLSLTTSFWPSSPLNRRSTVQANSLSAAPRRAPPYTVSINNLSTSPVITRQKAPTVNRSLFIRLWAISLGYHCVYNIGHKAMLHMMFERKFRCCRASVLLLFNMWAWTFKWGIQLALWHQRSHFMNV